MGVGRVTLPLLKARLSACMQNQQHVIVRLIVSLTVSMVSWTQSQIARAPGAYRSNYWLVSLIDDQV
jgi:hypothetical protein